VYKQNNNRAF